MNVVCRDVLEMNNVVTMLFCTVGHNGIVATEVEAIEEK
jgi:hypothetical protein